MFAQLENLAAIHPAPFEYATGIVKPMRQHMDLRVRPGNEFAIEPDKTVAFIEGDVCHDPVFLIRRCAACRKPGPIALPSEKVCRGQPSRAIIIIMGDRKSTRLNSS